MTATTITCAEVREALLALPLDRFAPGAQPFGAHVAGCGRCAADVARVRDAHARIGAALDAFADAGDVDAALALAHRTVGAAEPPPTRVRRIPPMLLAALALAALAVPLAPRPVPDADAPVPERRPALAVPDVSPVSPDVAPDVAPEPPAPPAPSRVPTRAAPVPVPVPAPARTTAPKPAPKPAPDLSTAAATTAPAPSAASVAPGCGDADALAFRADRGKLTASERVCLRRLVADGADGAAGASRLLLADAWRSDRGGWADLAAAHLTTVDPMDADVAYRLTLALAAAGEGRADDVIRWGGVAIGLAPGPERAVRLRAATTAAWLSRWRQLQGAGGEAAEQARASTAASAAAWAAESRRAGSDPSEADRVCALASGGVCPR